MSTETEESTVNETDFDTRTREETARCQALQADLTARYYARLRRTVDGAGVALGLVCGAVLVGIAPWWVTILAVAVYAAWFAWIYSARLAARISGRTQRLAWDAPAPPGICQTCHHPEPCDYETPGGHL